MFAQWIAKENIRPKVDKLPSSLGLLQRYLDLVKMVSNHQ
jgi:hypothetical protein